jgi:hypothetical protein
MREQKNIRWTVNETSILKESDNKRTINEIYEILKSHPKSSIKKKMELLGYRPLTVKFEWENSETDLLEKCEGKRIHAVLKLFPDRTEEAIRAKARQLNVRILSNRGWTQEEEDVLRNVYPNSLRIDDLVSLFEEKTIKQIRGKVKTMKLKKNTVSLKEMANNPKNAIECFGCKTSYLLESGAFPIKVLLNGETAITESTCSTCRNKRAVISSYKRKYGILLEFDSMFHTFSMEQWYRWKEIDLTPNGKRLRQLPEALHTEKNISTLGRYVINKVMGLTTRDELIEISQVDMEKYGIAFSRTPFVLNSPINLVSLCFPELNIKQWEFNSVSNNFWADYDNFLNALKCFCENQKHMIEKYGYDSIFNDNYLDRTFSKLNGAKKKVYPSKSWESCLNDLGLDVAFKKDRKISYDGNKLDSFEEVLLYDFLHQQLNIKVASIGRKRAGEYYYYDKDNEQHYAPDFVLKRKDKKDVIIEYFGMYTNRRHHEVLIKYKEKTHQKIEYFNSRKDVVFLSLFSEDLKNNFQGVIDKINKL